MKKQMVKDGRVVCGKTPSEYGTGKSERVKQGQALRKNEHPVKNLEDLEVPLDGDK